MLLNSASNANRPTFFIILGAGGDTTFFPLHMALSLVVRPYMIAALRRSIAQPISFLFINQQHSQKKYHTVFCD
jgi:hypothetical protein